MSRPEQKILDLQGLPSGNLAPPPGIRSATEPWALSSEESTLCRANKFGLLHKARASTGGRSRVIELRDSSLVTSDCSLQDPSSYFVAKMPARDGWFYHKVRMKDWHIVRENAKTGEFRTSARPCPEPFWLTWHPTPAIVTIMRARGKLQLLQRPAIPTRVRAKLPRKSGSGRNEASQQGQESRKSRQELFENIRFLRGTKP